MRAHALKKLLLLLVLVTGLWPLAPGPCLADFYGTYGNGTAAGDTVRIVFGTQDTTFLNAADCDSFFILRFFRGTLLDSTADDAAGVAKLRTGYYVARFRAANASGAAGHYDVRILAFKQGKTGIKTGTYQVVDGGILDEGDSSKLARSVWDNDLVAQANRTVANVGSGTGAYEVKLFTKRSDSTVIAGTQVQVLNQAQTATVGLLTANSLGQATFALDAGTYKVRLFNPGWQFTVPESVVVTGSTAKTFIGSLFDPGAPPQAALCRVYGWVYGLSGDSLSGVTITAQIKTQPLRYQNVVISPYQKSAVTNSSGYWHIDLYPTSILTPGTTQYEFTLSVGGSPVARRTVTVPNQSSWQLSW